MLDPKLWANIPTELKELSQWLVWRDDKIPYDPKSGKLADVTNKDTWASFDVACDVCLRGGYSGIGFVFTNNDPYSFIDLDNPIKLKNGEPNANYQVDLDRQIKIFKEFDSYAEVSPSGSGLHIIVRGRIDNGRRRSFIEIYSSGRYATFTGNIYHDKPIEDRQELLTQLWEQMGAGAPATYIYQGDYREKYTDQQILDQATQAHNGSKFVALYQGKWQNDYPSQSEADFAIIDIIAFYTQNKTQIERIFRASELGKRDKAQRGDYINRMINRSFDRMLPQLDFDGFKNALEDKIAKNKAASSNGKTAPFDGANSGSSSEAASNEEETLPLGLEGGSNSKSSSITIPPGLLGEIAQFIYQCAPRPVPEMAIAGAIGLMAGICGRAYNISGTGLNQYVLVLARTGRGKEAVALGIDKLMNSVLMQVPTAKSFRGPGIINSGQALIKHLSKVSNCFVSVLGEFGITIDRISAANANGSDKMLYQMLLDLYNKSGHNQTLQASIYANASDNVDMTASPALTILGESTHKKFYEVLNEDMIAAGLLPRFLIIDYSGKRVPLNKHHEHVKPPFSLIDRLATITATSEQIMHAKKVVNVKMTKEAEEMLDSFDKFADNKINFENNDAIEELWNRAHMKSIRLAALVAVGVNPFDPVVTNDEAKWAIELVQTDIKILTARFEKGEIGSNSLEIRQSNDMVKAIKEFVMGNWNDLSVKYKLSENPHHKMFDDKIIPYHFLSRRLISMSSFRNDRMGATHAIKRTIQTLIDSDKLREISKQDMVGRYNTTQRGFVISNTTIFD